MLYCCFGHIFNNVICYIFDNVEDTKKICFPTQKYVCYNCTLGKMYQYSFSKNSVCSSDPLGLIYLDFLKLSTLSYLKYKWMIIFLDDYFSYCNITFLYKKSEAAKVTKLIFLDIVKYYFPFYKEIAY